MGSPEVKTEKREGANEMPQDLFAYLDAMVNQLEGADGGRPDEELRGKLSALRAETQRVPAERRVREMSEIDVASEMDKLQVRLDSVERLVEASVGDTEVRSLLQNTAALWVPVITASSNERRTSPSETPLPSIPASGQTDSKT
eukprot:TRINITY_DN17151_c0_g1_i1.p1 TRINITY_DN17151_c0_g1~~TRINITY_DN17151_c0_g1_i1.p1  ORF type:complete len:144 (+),score=24.21 TRINITY_DN17151_c0_g1_i1:274-705(+)